MMHISIDASFYAEHCFMLIGCFTCIFCRVFVGTVSEFCVKHADCPVITIKRKADEAPQDPVDD